jgi:hypothetical protein
MPYIPFHDICPKIAEEETRIITILQNDNEFFLPKGDYVFIELFCDECDCRRVFLQIFMNQKIVGTIAYGWEKLSFYQRKFKSFDKKDIRKLKGPALDSFQYQSDISDRILKMFDKLLFSDKKYLTRIEKHYSQFRKALRQ